MKQLKETTSEEEYNKAIERLAQILLFETTKRNYKRLRGIMIGLQGLTLLNIMTETTKRNYKTTY